MGAFLKQRHRFESLTLGNLLRYAKLDDCVHFVREMELPESFESLIPKLEERRSIPKLPKNDDAKCLRHSIDLDTTSKVVLAWDGMPIMMRI